MASFIQTKVKIGASETHESNLKDANSLVSDAILNNLTVASFGYEYLLVDKYKIFLTSPMNDAVKKAHIGGIAYGFSQFAMFAVYSFLFYIAAIFVDKYSVNSEDLFLAIFIIMFSSYGSGQAQQFAPSAGKGKRAANRIFSIIDEESELDPFVKNEGQIETSNDNFRGDIEFRDVWFRYPTRRDVWVLRGLSFKISKDQAVGLAGESGCGKSTVIQLLYRFYDPQFGNIFIDGIDIKDYNIHSLRKQFGLVQQEPILFNYSVRDNILYSKMDATYQEIVESTKIANAIEFVDQLEPPKENEDKAMSLFNKEQKYVILSSSYTTLSCLISSLIALFSLILKIIHLEMTKTYFLQDIMLNVESKAANYLVDKNRESLLQEPSSESLTCSCSTKPHRRLTKTLKTKCRLRLTESWETGQRS